MLDSDVMDEYFEAMKEPVYTDRGTVQVFVYGTLKRGFRLNHFMEGEFICNALAHNYKLVGLGVYPGMVLADTYDSSVLGEVWEIDRNTLSKLDIVEGVPSLFDRVQLEVECLVEGSESTTIRTVYGYQFVAYAITPQVFTPWDTQVLVSDSQMYYWGRNEEYQHHD